MKIKARRDLDLRIWDHVSTYRDYTLRRVVEEIPFGGSAGENQAWLFVGGTNVKLRILRVAHTKTGEVRCYVVVLVLPKPEDAVFTANL